VGEVDRAMRRKAGMAVAVGPAAGAIRDRPARAAALAHRDRSLDHHRTTDRDPDAACRDFREGYVTFVGSAGEAPGVGAEGGWSSPPVPYETAAPRSGVGPSTSRKPGAEPIASPVRSAVPTGVLTGAGAVKTGEPRV
jgi:hypothetical protein